MRIKLDKIKDVPIELSEDIDAKRWEMDSFDVKFIKNIHLDCRFIRDGKKIIAECNVLTHRLIICSRCMEESEREVRESFKLSYPASSGNGYIEVDNDIRQEILLNFPMKVLCKPDCRGICPGCGANLNFEECRCKKESLTQMITDNEINICGSLL